MGRYLVVANQTLSSTQLRAKLQQVATDDGEATFHVVMPAARNVDADHALAASEHVRWPGEAMVVTAERMRLRTGLEQLERLGLDIDGEVVMASPFQAAITACDHGDYDEVFVSTLPSGVSRWLGMDLPNRLRRKLPIPVTHVESSTAVDA